MNMHMDRDDGVPRRDGEYLEFLDEDEEREEKCAALLDRAYASDDPEVAAELAKEVLKIDENDVEALLFLADAAEYSEEKISLLRRAKKELEHGKTGDDLRNPEYFLEGEWGMVYAGVLQRLGFALFSEGHNEEALSTAREIMNVDPRQETLARTLYYRILTDMGRDRDILEESLRDRSDNLARLHARAIASFRLSGADRTSYRALWDAISASPDVPFYMLGYFEDPEEESGEENEEFNFALLFQDAWSETPDLLGWLARAAVLLGTAALLFSDEEMDKMLVLADSMGIADFVEDALVRLEARDGWRSVSREERIASAIRLFREEAFLPLKERE